MGFGIGKKVNFKKSVESQGVFVGAVGEVVGEPSSGFLIPDEMYAVLFEESDGVYVSIYGKTLFLSGSEFLNEDIGSVGGIAEDRTASQSTVGAGAANGEGDKTGTMDGGAIAGAEHYSIEKAIADLEGGVDVVEIAEKLKTIAA